MKCQKEFDFSDEVGIALILSSISRPYAHFKTIKARHREAGKIGGNVEVD